jgi:uncharacterized protein YcfL
MQNKQTNTHKMKTKLFLAIFVIAISILLFSCESSEEENNSSEIEVVSEVAVVNTVTTPEPTIVPKKVLSPEEERVLLEKIPTITEAQDAYRIYLDNDAGTKVERAAYAKWEELMLVKIASMTDIDALYKIYLHNDAGTKVEKSAYERYIRLGGKN